MTLDEIQKQHDAALMPTYGRFPVALASGHGATAIDVEGPRLHRLRQRHRGQRPGLL